MNIPLGRRQFLISGALSLLGGVLYSRFAFAESMRTPGNYMVGPHDAELESEMGVGILDLRNGSTRTVATGFEGHSVVAKPGEPGRVVMFAQRPGTRCAEVDIVRGELVRVFDSQPGRHFYGHGMYTADAAHLFTTENSYEDGRGIVTIRSDDDLEVIEEFDTHGLDPHELYFIESGRVAVVANGGLKTSPKHRDGYRDYDRENMRSSLVLIEAANGKLIDRFELENRWLSIRHLSISPNQTIAMAIQDKEKGSDFSGGPLICVRFPDGRVVEMKDGDGLYRRMNYHTLSISLFEERSVLGVTSPTGNRVTFWNSATGELLREAEIENPSGIALTSDHQRFVVTSNRTGVHLFDSNDLTQEPNELDPNVSIKWGSHLASIVA